MRSDSRVAHAILIIWLGSFLYCLIVLVRFQPDIPNRFPALMNEVIDTFAPSLALMLTFVFAERRIARRAVRTSLFKGVVALVVCVTYVSYMTALVHRFASERLHADELAGLISFARTR